MAQADGKPPVTSGAPDAGGDKGGGQRKIAGKFNSVEEAIESIASSQEKNYHETREDISTIKQLLERAMTPIGERGGYEDQGYQRGRNDEGEDDLNPTEFLSTPGKVLKRREDRMIKQITENQARQTAAMINNAATVLRFQTLHPDLDDHEVLVQGFLKETNPNDPLMKRLKEAGKRTRDYIAKMKKEDNGNEGEGEAGRKPDKEEYVEESAGARQGESGPVGGETEDESDDSLAAYVAERKTQKSSRFAAPQRGSGK